MIDQSVKLRWPELLGLFLECFVVCLVVLQSRRFLTLLRRLRLCWLGQEELGRRLERMTGHQHQLLELQQLLDVLGHEQTGSIRSSEK